MQGNATEIARLRAHIANIERRFTLTSSGVNVIHGAGSLTAPRGVVHEVFSDDQRNTGATLGFSLAQARSLIAPTRPALILLQLAGETAETGLPYGPGLEQFGIAPDTVTMIQANTIADLLWALEESITCTAIAGVIADLARPQRALDFTASRRLTLRAAATGVSVFLMRYGKSREASAARYRWRVIPAASAPPAFDASAPGRPRFSVVLEKGRLPDISQGTLFTFDWISTDGFVRIEPGPAPNAAASARQPAAVSRAEPAALGHRLSEPG